MCDTKPGADDELKLALQHGRELFIYHAGQRMASIRFYLVALGVVVAGYVGLFSKGSGGVTRYEPLSGIILGLIGLVITLCFWALDERNAQLVVIDETLLDAVERKLATRSNIIQYHIIRASNERAIWPQWLTYKAVMPLLFSFFASLSLATIIFSMWIMVAPS